MMAFATIERHQRELTAAMPVPGGIHFGLNLQHIGSDSIEFGDHTSRAPAGADPPG